VKEARVNLATERAGVVVDPGRVSETELAKAVAQAGYSARRAELKLGEGPKHFAASVPRGLPVGVVG